MVVRQCLFHFFFDNSCRIPPDDIVHCKQKQKKYVPIYKISTSRLPIYIYDVNINYIAYKHYLIVIIYLINDFL